MSETLFVAYSIHFFEEMIDFCYGFFIVVGDVLHCFVQMLNAKDTVTRPTEFTENITRN
jgi:hypothetical protein